MSGYPPGARWVTVCWETELGADVRSTPAVTTTRVFVGSGDGRIYALDRRRGSVRWRFDAGSPVDGSPTVFRNLVYVTARNGALYALGVDDGRLRWKHASRSAIPFRAPQGNLDYVIASPVVADSTVYAGGPDGHVYALAALSGAVQWDVSLAASIWASPAIAGQTVYVAANDGRLYALDRRTGARRWVFATAGSTMDLQKEGYDRRSIQSAPAVADGVVVFGSRDSNVYGVDAASGRELWRTGYASSWVSGGPAIRNDTAFITTSDAKVVAALDAHTGRELWRSPVGARVFPGVTLVGQSALVGTDGGELISLESSTGAVRWRFATGAPVQASATLHSDVLYFGSDGGHVFAIAVGDRGYPALAVFWDPQYTKEVLQGGSVLRDYFALRGYEVLDTRGLAAWLSQRAEDGRPSVVVFAQDILPSRVAADTSDTVLFRRYLQRGGKVVWFGNPPLMIPRDSVGGIARGDFDYPNEMTVSRTEKLLGVSYKGMQADAWPARPTSTGRAWGLSAPILAGISLDTTAASEVLELTQTGRASAWVHRYGGPPATGFVFLGAGGIPQELPVPVDQLASVRRVAEFGVLRRPEVAACR